MMQNYEVVPNDRVKKRMDYFFSPYNAFYNVHKSMSFDEPENWQQVKDVVLSRDKNLAEFFKENLKNLKRQEITVKPAPRKIYRNEASIFKSSHVKVPSLSTAPGDAIKPLDVEQVRRQFARQYK